MKIQILLIFIVISCSAFKLHSQNLIKFLWGGPYSPHKKCNLDVEQLILDEIIQQLKEDIPDNIKARTQDVRFLAQRFKDDYLSSEQSIFDQDTFLETTSILKEALDTIDKNTYYKDTDYWGLYEAIETFLYGELNPGLDDGDYWGIKGFSLIWEDMCNTYFFRKHKAEICYADTDIPLKDHDNPLPQRREEKNRVGNCAIKVSNGSIFWQQWIYSTESDKAEDDIQELKWHQLLVIEFNLNPRHLVLTNGAVAHPDYQEDYGYDTENSISLRRKFLRPDLVLTNRDFNLRIIDYKDVPLEFYLNPSNLSPKEQNKYKHDIIKQLTYELALQQTHTVSENLFFLPYYYESPPINDLGEVDPSLDIKGIRVFKANFFLIQSEYLQENLL